MPIPFQRAPHPFFKQLQEQQYIEHRKRRQEPNHGLRLYPLQQAQEWQRTTVRRPRQGGVQVPPLYSGQRAEGRNQRAEGRGQRAEGRGQRADSMIPPSHLPAANHQPRNTAPPVRKPASRNDVPPLPLTSDLRPMPSDSLDAARQFQRVNQNLPDGVRYEPLDNDTLRLLRGQGAEIPPMPEVSPMPNPATPMIPHSQSPPPEVPPPQSPPPLPASNLQSLNSALESMVQNERNANVFYGHFAEMEQDGAKKEILTALAGDSGKRSEQCAALLAKHFDNSFTPRETNIATNRTLPEAISLALAEGSKSLIAFGNLLDEAAGTAIERDVERIICRKLLSHQLLLTLNSKGFTKQPL